GHLRTTIWIRPGDSGLAACEYEPDVQCNSGTDESSLPHSHRRPTLRRALPYLRKWSPQVLDHRACIAFVRRCRDLTYIYYTKNRRKPRQERASRKFSKTAMGFHRPSASLPCQNSWPPPCCGGRVPPPPPPRTCKWPRH